jgi:hypothetical protein
MCQWRSFAKGGFTRNVRRGRRRLAVKVGRIHDHMIELPLADLFREARNIGNADVTGQSVFSEVSFRKKGIVLLDFYGCAVEARHTRQETEHCNTDATSKLQYALPLKGRNRRREQNRVNAGAVTLLRLVHI